MHSTAPLPHLDLTEAQWRLLARLTEGSVPDPSDRQAFAQALALDGLDVDLARDDVPELRWMKLVDRTDGSLALTNPPDIFPPRITSGRRCYLRTVTTGRQIVKIRAGLSACLGRALVPGRHVAPTQGNNRLVTLTREVLKARGFQGFAPFSQLAALPLPLDSGIYVVFRTSDAAPTFLATSTAGWRKGRDPAVSLQQLAAKWVQGTEVLYIGKADAGTAGRHGLRGRLRQYARHGLGRTSHHGGRYIWQLQDSATLLVAWKPSSDARAEEVALLAEFEAQHHALPFANLKH
jgi:hypothetical protein